jgi:hypothetical protein
VFVRRSLLYRHTNASEEIVALSSNRFLAKGMFPKEIPPNFGSLDAGRAFVDIPVASIPDMNRKLRAVPDRFSLGRSGGVRRELALPNPVIHYHLATEIQTHWRRLMRRCSLSPLSVSSPVRQGAGNRAAVPRVPYRRLVDEQIRVRRRGRYLLRADIAECYRSVYTHAIAWSVESRKIASAKPNEYGLLGNRLDRAVRNAQGGQTNGIPVGPDTSLVLGELVLSDVDRRLLKRVAPIAGFRFFDDYELVFHSISDAEEALALLGMLGAEYGFQLHPQKTGIRELPAPLEEGWVHTLASFNFGSGERRRQRILQFFDITFETKARLPASNVVAYALARVSRTRFSAQDWELVEPLIYQAAYAEPAAIEKFVITLERQYRHGRALDHGMLANLIHDFVCRHAPLGHTFEVSWPLWAAIRFGIPLDGAVCRAVGANWDSVTALLVLDARSRNLTPASQFDDGPFQKALVDGCLRDRHWLLAYEAVVQEWLPPPTTDLIGADPVFSFFRARDVRFYTRFHRAKSAPVEDFLGSLEEYDPDDEYYFDQDLDDGDWEGARQY